jgi:hypothetical protein
VVVVQSVSGVGAKVGVREEIRGMWMCNNACACAIVMLQMQHYHYEFLSQACSAIWPWRFIC